MAQGLLTVAIIVDPGKKLQDARIERGTRLFRLASPLFSSQSDLLNGQGALAGDGRYHIIQQPTSYVSDNALLCMAEILYHMSRKALKVLGNNGTAIQWQNSSRVRKHLVIFEVHAIPDLVYIDTEDSRQQIPLQSGRLIPSSVVVHPDQLYEPLQLAANVCRGKRKDGVVYPSARHSRGLAIALLENHTNSINRIMARLELDLALVEDETRQRAPAFSPHSGKISHSRGYYEFANLNEFASHQRLLVPLLIHPRGFIEFVRRPYSSYPSEAVL